MTRPLSAAPLPAGRSEADWVEHCRQVSQVGNDAMLQSALQAAVAAHPLSARLQYNLGVAHQRRGHAGQAHAAWMRCIASEPGHLKAHRGLALLALDALDGPSALRHAVLASQSDATLSDAVSAAPLACLLGKAHLLNGDWDAAQRCFEQAADHCQDELSAASDEARQGLALTRLLTWRALSTTPPGPAYGDQPPWDAVDSSAMFSASAPFDSAPLIGDHELKALTLIVEFGLKRLHACDWRERDTVVRAIRRMAHKARQDPSLELARSVAWEGLHLDLTPEELLYLARGAAQRARRIQGPCRLWSGPSSSPTLGRRWRLGYLSHNFGRHPTTQLIHRLLGYHDRSRFEVIAYALNPHDGSPSRAQIHAAVDRVVDASQWPPETVARQIQADGVDVLIGLGGHARGAVLDVALWRPAPVQINYLAFCGTVGAPDAFDVHVGDAVSIPPEMACWYDEAVIALPGGHFPYDETRVLGPAPSRVSQGLPEDGLVLCGFNNSYKIEPLTFDAWCDVLGRLPKAVLWLYVVHPEQSAFLAAEAELRGINPARLVFAPRVEGLAHLARLQCADLFLDSFAYNAHTTMLDALYAGLPAVSCLGLTAASRIGGAILTELGLSTWVASRASEFVDLAVRLAKDVGQRQAIATHLREVRGRQTPFNSEARCRQLEAVYLRLITRT